MGIIGAGLAVLIALLFIVWGALTLHYLGPGAAALRTAQAVVFALLCLSALALVAKRRTRAPALVFLGVVIWLPLIPWFLATPSNSHRWQTEVAKLPYATFSGDQVTVHNIRNFDYRSETDFDARYYDRTFNLSELDRVDMLAAYWMGPAIAHVFLSFGFGAEHLSISIEARKQSGEGYSTLAGFFRQYELFYVVADERDVVRLRTDIREPAEDVYLYRLTAPIENGRKLFLSYLQEINALRERPKFYNTLTSNCTTLILSHAAVNSDRPPFTWRVLLSGYLPEYAYDVGRVDRSLPFRQLQERAYINERARGAAGADYSEVIRSGVP